MTDPKKIIYNTAGPGPGGGSSGPHISVDLVDLLALESPRARAFVTVAFLQQLTDYAAEIRDQNPGAYRELSNAITKISASLANNLSGFEFSTGP
jgi:hypothetical protein